MSVISQWIYQLKPHLRITRTYSSLKYTNKRCTYPCSDKIFRHLHVAFPGKLRKDILSVIVRMCDKHGSFLCRLTSIMAKVSEK